MARNIDPHKRLCVTDEWLVRYIRANIDCTQSDMANNLRKLGYVSPSGLPLTNDHISIFMRTKLGIRKMPPHRKVNYRGRNWIICNRLAGRPVRHVTTSF